MPFPNEHAARIHLPSKYKRFRRKNDAFGKGVHVIYGIREKDGEDVTEVQAIRFDSSTFTVAQAKAWLKKNEYSYILFEPAAKKGENSFVLPVSSGKGGLLCEQSAEGVKSVLYRKELICVGKYYKSDIEMAFEVTSETLIHWVNVFKIMLENGVKIPVLDSHYSDQNNGYVRELFIDGDVLVGILELFGDDIELKIKTNDVSIYAPVEWVDGAGFVYYRPIVHVALTPCPLIPGLREFESLAASFLVFKEKVMDVTVEKLVAVLGMKPKPGEDAGALVLSGVEKLKGSVADLTKELATEKGKTGKSGKPDEKEKDLKLSGEKKPDPVIVSMKKELRGMKLASLVASGKITPAVKEKLETTYATDEALVFSIVHGDDKFDALIGILEENDPVGLTESTGSQTLELSKKTNAGLSPLVADAQSRAKAAKPVA